MLAAPLDYLKARGVRTIGSIAFATAFGDAFVAALKPEAAKRGISFTGVETYNLTDPSVTPQTFKVAPLARCRLLSCAIAILAA